jgi:hypothetical protein
LPATRLASQRDLNLLLANPAGNISIVDGFAVGTIVNDDPIALRHFRDPGRGASLGHEGRR